MGELQSVLAETLNERLNQIILSNTRDEGQAGKVRIRPVLIGGELKFQETKYRGAKVYHENFSREEIALKIEKYLQELFRQGEIDGGGMSATVLISKKGRRTVKVRRKDCGARAPQDRTDWKRTVPEESDGESDLSRQLSHNRVKNYILPEGEPVDFLVDLGVQTPDGRIAKSRYDKFRQINRFLEFIRDVLDELPADRTLRIVDFGCGKSYLTFAMYYYLRIKEGRDIRVTGLDLKEDVILHCSRLAKKLGYDGLCFQQGDIGTYQGEEGADMVVSLHACDTATDYALDKAVRWGAKVILAVPCCQHEINRQIKCDMLRPALKYGIIKERISALITDAVRAQILEQRGYDTQILEFIDMEHTPKNLLIRAVKRQNMRPSSAVSGLREMEEYLQICPTLEKLEGEEV